MTKEQIEYCNIRFLELKDHSDKATENAGRIVSVNKYLENFNWIICSPYLPGYIINHFEDLQKSNTGNRENVFKIFAHFFFDLKQTALFIDGYFKRRPFLEPFCQIIDQSVFMCLQKDYAGAITALLPIIEGAIRIYLINRSNKPLVQVNQKQLIEAFSYAEEDFRIAVTNYFSNEYSSQNKSGLCFTAQQIEELVSSRCSFFNIWVFSLKNYIDKNFFFQFNKDGTPKDNLSRNVILHGFNSEIYYDLENYLKLFNCITYISYVFGMPDPNSNTLIELGVDDIIYKWKAFEKIRSISELMTDIKASVYKPYNDFDEKKFREKFTTNEMEKIFSKMSPKKVERKLHKMDVFFEKVSAHIKKQPLAINKKSK